MDNSFSEEKRDKLASENTSRGVLLVSKSVDEILAYAFGKVLPVLTVSNIDTVRLAFAYLQKSWKSEYLVETETELIEDIIRTNLERDSQHGSFSCFDVTIGTEADEESILYWKVRVNDEEFKALCQIKFMQIDVLIGTTFKGYRVWRVKYKWGDQATALAAMADSILL